MGPAVIAASPVARCALAAHTYIRGERGPLAVSQPPKANMEQKEGRTKARAQQTHEQGQRKGGEEEEEEEPDQQEEKGEAKRQGERVRTSQLLAPGATTSGSRPRGAIEFSLALEPLVCSN